MQIITETQLSFKEQMEALKARYNLTHQQFAIELGYTKATINRWHRTGDYPPSLPNTLKGLEQRLMNAQDVDK